jgi:hypothetical protein
MMPAQQNLKEKEKIKNPKKNVKYEQSIHQQFCCFLSLVSIMQNLQLSCAHSAEDLVARNRLLDLISYAAGQDVISWKNMHGQQILIVIIPFSNLLLRTRE